MNTKHKDIIDNLDPSVKMLLDKVKRFLMAGKASVMIGSGFSLNAENDGTGKMREWNALNLDLYKSLYGSEPKQGELEKLSPVRLAAQVASAHGEHELDEIIMNALPDKSVYPGNLHRKLMKLHWRDVFTTNYDTLLERSCDESGSAYTLVTTKETLLYSQSPRIIKLHGSFPDVRPFIMSDEQFRTYPQKYPEFVNTVRQSLIESLFCLIGFSGDDPNFLSWLGWIRDVMGKQMTNVVMVTYKPKGIHVSERQLFASRKIDIMNLAEVKGIETFTEALDFFLTYVGTKDKSVEWDYPQLYHGSYPGDKTPHDYKEDIKKMTAARNSYPGWLYIPERYLVSSCVSRLPFLEKCYTEIAEDLKVSYLFELDWLLDVCLYPKDEDWFLNALKGVKDNYETYQGANKEKARKLIVSLMSYYRERRMADEYLEVTDFITQKFFEELTPKQKSIFYYEQCLWNLSLLEYKNVYAILLRWHITDNDFLSALWQASIYAELGDHQIAEDKLRVYYSRLTTRMLLDSKSEYLNSCAQMYSYVIPRVINRIGVNFELPADNALEQFKRNLVDNAQKEQPQKSQTHGFNIGNVTRTSHAYQGGFVADYLNASRYIRLSYLHGSTFRIDGFHNIDEYRKVLSVIAKYNLYQAIALTIRCGKDGLIDNVLSREHLDKVSRDVIAAIFTDLTEMMKVNVEDSPRKQKIAFAVLVPALQHLCGKASDDQIDLLFDFVMNHLDDHRIKINQLLETIYNCATKEQKAQMFKKVLCGKIVRDDRWNDILWPEYAGDISLEEDTISYLGSAIKHKELKKLAYFRIITLLGCKLPQDQKNAIEKIIIEWRKDERKDVNSFFSYHVVPSTTDEDKESEQWWIRSTLDEFLSRDYSFKGSSECITDFVHFLDSIIPALDRITDDDLAKIISKITDVLTSYMPQLKTDDRNELMGGFRHFTSRMFDVMKDVFSQIDFGRVDGGKRQVLSRLLLDCFEVHHPCLYHLCVMTEGEERIAVAQSAHSRLLSSVSDERQDAILALFYFIKNKDKVNVTEASAWSYVKNLNYFIQYSHCTYLSTYLNLLAELYANKFLDAQHAEFFCDALLTVYREIDSYEMDYEYKVDIIHYSCILAAVFFKLGIKHSAIDRWKEISDDPDQFRDVRSGWEKGIDMVIA